MELWALVTNLLVIIEVHLLHHVISAARLADIHWISTNPMFRIDNTDHIIDVNKGNAAFEYDQVNIVCPKYQKNIREEDTETYIIYNVSKEEYDSCHIRNERARRVAICNKPYQNMYFTITFRSFTPQPGGLEFKPGQDYYFISTSSGRIDGLENKLAGRCATHNMKLVFKVCCKNNHTNYTKDDHISNESKPSLPHSSSSSNSSLSSLV